jgi:hypothetical protein
LLYNAPVPPRPGWSVVLALSLGCSTARPAKDDAGAIADASPASVDAAPGSADAAPADAGLAWRHSIAIDGTDDFIAGERFATTTAGYGLSLTWDAAAIYVGGRGADVAGGTASRWLFVYFDLDPGAGTGALVGERYNTQRPVFPEGFGAERYLRVQASGGVEDLKSFNGAAWQVTLTGVDIARAGDFAEIAVPLAALGAAERVGIVAFWLNEAGQAVWSYGGLYPDAFVDGYHAENQIGRFVELDRSSTTPPADADNRRPVE